LPPESKKFRRLFYFYYKQAPEMSNFIKKNLFPLILSIIYVKIIVYQYNVDKYIMESEQNE